MVCINEGYPTALHTPPDGVPPRFDYAYQSLQAQPIPDKLYQVVLVNHLEPGHDQNKYLKRKSVWDYIYTSCTLRLSLLC